MAALVGAALKQTTEHDGGTGTSALADAGRVLCGVPHDPWSQEPYGVRFEWGPAGTANLATPEGALVIVDALSFTTAVTVCVERGVAVYPSAWKEGRAAELARDVDALVAVGRREMSEQHPWSLSPAALRRAPAPPRLVLPSPNGSSIAAAAAGGVVVAACLRNAGAVGRWLSPRFGTPERPLTVVAAGERWPDGSLRPALEDLLGAGAVLSALTHEGRRAVSPEAAAARTVYEATDGVAAAVRACASGVELVRAGFEEDVEIAVELDTSDVVPVLTDGAFRRG